MIILGVHFGHDAAACVFEDGKLLSYCKEERLTRIKNDGAKFDLLSIQEVLEISGKKLHDIDVLSLSRTHLPLTLLKKTHKPFVDAVRRLSGVNRMLSNQMVKLGESSEEKIVDYAKLLEKLGLRSNVKVQFVNHHYSHILGAFAYSDWSSDALYLSCDGGGDNAFYSAYKWDGSKLECLMGGDETLLEKPQKSWASIGRAYSAVTAYLGFTPIKHEGKITGLAAFGKPIISQDFLDTYILREDGSIDSVFDTEQEWQKWFHDKCRGLSREDLAASIQIATEELVVKWIEILRNLFPASYLGLSGGVFSNVRLNQKVAEIQGVKEIFVFPAMGDEGLAVGNAIAALYDSGASLNEYRGRLENVYLGRIFSGQDLFDSANKEEFELIESDVPSKLAANLLNEGEVGAIFNGRMEMGPRALGARTILASPENRGINDSLNNRLDRTEFMPFAPYVLDIDLKTVFKVDERTEYACEFMTVTSDVNPEYKDMISAVVHVDGTARPQVIKRAVNGLYYDILVDFKELSGRPCLVNTSFNAHEEPIINTPQEALEALRSNRIDFLVCEIGLIKRINA